MIKNITTIEVKVSDKLYRFFCEVDAPITEIKEALFQFMAHVKQAEDAAVQMQKAKEAADAAEAAKQIAAEEVFQPDLKEVSKG